jgi:hypothetical protein
MLVRISILRAVAFPGAVLALLSFSCAKKPPSGGSGTYRGVLVSSTSTGSIDVTVGEASRGPLPASGTIVLGGTTVSLSGTLDRSNATLSLSSTDGYQLTGDSRPAYAFGSFTSSQDMGSFAMYLEPANSTPVLLFCGSFSWIAPADTSPSPFAVAATPSGAAMCVGPSFVWFGNLGGNDALACEGSATSVVLGNVAVDAGNQWGTGTDDQGNGDYGSWTVAPCGASAADGPDGGSGSAAD